MGEHYTTGDVRNRRLNLKTTSAFKNQVSEWCRSGTPHPTCGVTRVVRTRRHDLSACRPELTVHEHVRLADRSYRRMAPAATTLCYLRRERPGHVLQTSALVNEAFIRLLNWRDVSWQNRAHFLAMAARLMRHILVDLSRRRATDRDGREIRIVDIGEADAVAVVTRVRRRCVDSLSALPTHAAMTDSSRALDVTSRPATLCTCREEHCSRCRSIFRSSK